MTTPVATRRVSNTLIEVLPVLRRYACAVSGSVERGDEWVRVCAEIVLRQPELVAREPDGKLAMFALFHRLREPLVGGEEEAAGMDSDSGRMDRALAGLPPRHRQMLILAALEEFSIGEAADILALDRAGAEKCFNEARTEIRRRLRDGAGRRASQRRLAGGPAARGAAGRAHSAHR